MSTHLNKCNHANDSCEKTNSESITSPIFTPFRIEDAQSTRSNPPPEGGILNENLCKKNGKHDINFDQYMNALSCISGGISRMVLQDKINKLSLKHKKTLLDYCNRMDSSSITILERFIKQIVMKIS